MRHVFGSRLRRTLVILAAVTLLALAPAVATGAMLAADGGPKLACMFRAEEPNAVALEGMLPEDAFGFMSATASPLAGFVSCTYQRTDGEAYWVSHARAMPVAGVIACYVLAFAIAVTAWLTRPRLWLPQP